MNTPKAVIVVPTIREQCLRDFLAAWKVELASAHIIVVEDHPTATFSIQDVPNVTHYAWDDIDSELGRDSWIIPRRTDCIRSYGYYKAYQQKPDLIITLDDDCFPDNEHPNFIQRHWDRIQSGGDQEAWCSTGEGTIPRGVPYFARHRRRSCVVNHGLWTHVPDYDAPTQLLQSRQTSEFIGMNQTIPVGMYFPMCGMNLAFLPEVVPALYFLLMGPSWPFDRFGDIWAGIILKKICDHLGYAINSGDPYIRHQRASNVWDNLRKEATGLRTNEELWLAIDQIGLRAGNFRECYGEIARGLQLSGEYWDKLKEAIPVWLSIFD